MMMMMVISWFIRVPVTILSIPIREFVDLHL
jgi:hypothetical protein